MNTDKHKKYIEFLDMLEEKYGELMQFSPSSGKISGLNPRFIAQYFSHMLPIKFCITKQKFMEYNPEGGTWNYLSDDKFSEQLWGNLYDALKPLEHGDVLSTYIKPTLLSTVMKLLKSIQEHDSSEFENNHYFHAANCMVVFDMEKKGWKEKPFSPDFYSHSRSAIVHDPYQTCPRFLNELLRPAMTEDDIEILQIYLGQCFLRRNFAQMMLILTGTGGAGKSVLVNIMEKIIGKEHCAELRPHHTGGRFEMGSYRNKKLLLGKDVESDYLNNSGARSLKVLTGNDMVTAEYKNANKRDNFDGNFNIIITSNNTLRLKFDGDRGAWERRILLINYKNPPPKKQIPDFDTVLLQEEGSGILNWIMEGSSKLAQNGLTIPKNEYQRAAVDSFLKSSDPLAYFGDLYIHPTPGAAITSAEIIEQFTKFCHLNKWDMPIELKLRKELKSYMAEKHGASQSNSIKRGGKSQRGYYGYQIRNKIEE